MEIKRTTEFFIETTRRFVVHRQPESIEKIFCPECDAPMLAAEQIAAIFNISRRAVYQLIETGAAHFAETEMGAVMICPPSLEAVLRGDAKQITGGGKNLNKFEEKI